MLLFVSAFAIKIRLLYGYGNKNRPFYGYANEKVPSLYTNDAVIHSGVLVVEKVKTDHCNHNADDSYFETAQRQLVFEKSR